MTKMKQKDAVYQAITSVLSEHGIDFEDGMNVEPHMNKELRGEVAAILVEGFKAGRIELDSVKTDAQLKNYVSGLTSNWIRKDGRLNGNTKYTPKNPGSRAGQGDAQLKAMRALLQTKSDPTERAEIQSFIDRRTAEVASEKAKKVTINIEDLPAELRAKYVSN